MNINDFLGLLGQSGLVLALIFSVLTLLLSIRSIFAMSKKKQDMIPFSTVAQACALCVSVLCLAWLLLNNAFEYTSVFDAVEKGMPWVYKLSGLWSGQSSSLMFWSFVLSVFIAIFVNRAKRQISSDFAAVVALTLSIGLIFYLVPVVFINNPFERLWQMRDGFMIEAVIAPKDAALIVPIDGMGMNPSLRHPAMLVHPPALYIGLIGFFVPFAFALASLALGDQSYDWIKQTYPATVFAWIFLTAGMFLGSWWAYTIIGWGGYWGWDAVEISGLLPWLLSFGLIHSMQMQLRGKDFLAWNYLFSGLIVFFALSGILITRSGILESVHAYSAGVLGPVLSILIILNIAPFIFLFVKRGLHQKLKRKPPFTEVSSRLAILLNIFLLILVFIYFVGQTYPLTSQLIIGEKISWTPATYERISSPILLAILVVTALFPISDNKTGRLINDRRLAAILFIVAGVFPLYLLFTTKIGLFGAFGFWVVAILILSWISRLIKDLLSGFDKTHVVFSLGKTLVHLGLGFSALGILGSESLSRQFESSIRVGEQKDFNGITLIGQSRDREVTEAGTEIYTFNLQMIGGGSAEVKIAPHIEYYPKMNMFYARPAVDAKITGDIQIILSEWERASDGSAGIRINIYPFIMWIWIGGITMGLGGLILLTASRFIYPALKK